jgi:AraC-like DNA-binding protein
MEHAVSDSNKYLNYGLVSMRLEVTQCIELSKNEIEIHFADRTPQLANASKKSNLPQITARRNRTFHRHSEIEIVYVEQGRIGNLVSGHVVWHEPGKLAAFWGAVPHTPVGVTPGTVYNWIKIPFSWFLGWKLPSALNDAILAGKTLSESDEQNSVGDQMSFQRWHAELRDGSAESRKIVLLECEARLRRLVKTATLAPSGRGRRVEGITGGSDAVEQMTRFVATHYPEQLRMADIAEHVGLHPNYAAALFRRTCGVSILDYIKEYRVYHAQRLLTTTDDKILDIAMSTGFGSASRFYCAFRDACGLTPREYRTSMSTLLGSQG